MHFSFDAFLEAQARPAHKRSDLRALANVQARRVNIHTADIHGRAVDSL